MNDDLYVLPRHAVERLVLESLLAAGLRVDAAALLARSLACSDNVTRILTAWTAWSTLNCLDCVHQPGTCPFFAAAHGLEELHAVCASIETEPFNCPERREGSETPPA